MANIIQRELHLPQGLHSLAGQSHVLLTEKSATDLAIEGGWGPIQDHRKQIFEKTDKIFWTRTAHNLLHYQVEGTLRILRKYVEWPQMRADVVKYVKSCPNCALFTNKDKRSTQEQGLAPLPDLAGFRFDHIQLDIKYEDAVEQPNTEQYKYILTIVDVYTGYIVLIPMISMDGGEVFVCFMDRWGYKFGLPNKISSDQGNHFYDIINFVILNGGSSHDSTAGHSRSHGKVENVNR